MTTDATVPLKAAWEVNAGVIPGHFEPEYRKQFFYTGPEFDEDMATERPEGQLSNFQKKTKEAYDYAASITDPRCVNFVQTNFVWY